MRRRSASLIGRDVARICRILSATLWAYFGSALDGPLKSRPGGGPQAKLAHGRLIGAARIAAPGENPWTPKVGRHFSGEPNCVSRSGKPRSRSSSVELPNWSAGVRTVGEQGPGLFSWKIFSFGMSPIATMSGEKCSNALASAELSQPALSSTAAAYAR